ncbi:hypothetical protein V500_07553 [Pseudogymnoascus sp. VKM F-4518 (FW-2643)]|nr:hypothetical protein V500_07553 [Pseudogymnoascus sp. VKM F-4518 (FW-2643)]
MVSIGVGQAVKGATQVHRSAPTIRNDKNECQLLARDAVWKLCHLSAAELLSAGVVAAQVAVADLRVGTGLRIRHGVCENGAREQHSGCGDDSGELHGDLDEAIG